MNVASDIPESDVPESILHVADHPAFVFGAYFAAFAPLAIIYALDLISEKWKTIKDTRRAGYLILLLSIPSLVFLFVYIHMQKLAEDYKEMAAATSAAIYSVLHLFRTIWGLMQLGEFKRWNEKALLRLKELGYDVLHSDSRFQRRYCRRKCESPHNERKFLARDSDSSMDYRGSKTSVQEKSSSSDDTNSDEDFFLFQMTFSELVQHMKKKLTSLIPRMKSNISSIQQRAELYFNPNAGKRKACPTCIALDKVERTVNDEMVVNSSLIDNEFAHAELPCQLDILPMLNAFWKSRRSIWTVNPSEFMRCKLPEECTVQWIVAFLSRFGSNWLLDSRHTNTVNDLAVLAALQVTHQVNYGNFNDPSETEHESVLSLSHAFAVDRREIQSSTLHMTDEVRDSLPYRLRSTRDLKRIDFAAYESNIRDAIASWHTVAVNKLEKNEREAVTKIQPYQVAMFAKLIGGDSENNISIDSIENEIVPDLTYKTFNDQLGNFGKSDVFESLPFRRQFSSVLLWKGKERNRLLLQASLHVDNWLSLESGQRQQALLVTSTEDFRTRQPTETVFLFQNNLEKSRLQNDLATAKDVSYVSTLHKTQFVGCIIETVRSFLGTWLKLSRAEDVSVWTPNIISETCQFRSSSQLIEEVRKVSDLDDTPIPMSGNETRNLHMRIIWEVQYALHDTVSKIALDSTQSVQLPRCVYLIMLFIMGYPSLSVKKAKEEVYTSFEEENHHSTIEQLIVFEIMPVQGPQSLCITASFSTSAGTCSIALKSIEDSTHPIKFDWQIWKDACYGKLYSQSQWRAQKLFSNTEKLRKEVLQVEISKPVSQVSKKIIQTDFDLITWHGWPPHLTQIAGFEIKHSEEMRKLEPYEVMCENSEIVVSRLEHAMNSLAEKDSEKETGQSLYAESKIWGRRGLRKQWQESLLRCISDYGHADSLNDVMNHLFSGGTIDMDALLRSIHRGISKSVMNKEQGTNLDYKLLDVYKVAEYCDQINSLSYRSDGMSIHFLKGLALFYAIEFDKGIDEKCIDAFESGLFHNSDCFFYLSLAYYRMYHRNNHQQHKQLAAKFIRSYKSSGALKTSFAYLFEKGYFIGLNCKRLNALDDHVKKWVDGPLLSKLFRFLFIRPTTTGLKLAHSDDEMEKHVDIDSEDQELSEGIYKDFNRAARMYKSAIRLHKTRTIREYADAQNPKNSGGDASNRLGMMYHKGPELSGEPTRQDFRSGPEEGLIGKAAKFYLEAVEMSNTDALCNLGILHAEREDELRNEIRAYEFMERAVSRQHLTAMNNLAVMTEKEIGCKRDTQQALELYEKSIRMGRHPISSYNLGVLLKFGDRTIRNVKRANKIFKNILERSDFDQVPILVEQAEQALKLKPLAETEEKLEYITVIDEFEDAFAYIKLIYDY